MKYRPRQLSAEIIKAARNFPAILVTGPRRVGKTTLLRRVFPRARYVLLEDPDVVSRVRADPRGFLNGLEEQVILDEIQNTPELVNYIRSRIDAKPDRFGRWLLTGSQEAPLMRGITESMAGRVAVFQLLPFSAEEARGVSLLRGGFPEAIARPEAADIWFRSYVQTYLERDVRAVSAIRDLTTFRRFIALLAGRCGRMLNKTDLAAPLGVSVPTITDWLAILELTGQIILLPPFYENFGKRLIKTPKLHFTDSGLACHLLGIRDEETLRNSIFLGPLFEGLVASEILKHRLNRGLGRDLYYFRDRQGLEVDLIVDIGNRRLAAIEAKSTQTPKPGLARSLLKFLSGVRAWETDAYLVHESGRRRGGVSPLSPPVRAVAWTELGQILSR